MKILVLEGDENYISDHIEKFINSPRFVFDEKVIIRDVYSESVKHKAIKELMSDIKKGYREKGASKMHIIWSHWMQYLATKGSFDEEGNFCISSKNMNRWVLQMNTPYESLSEKEKESDREIFNDLFLRT